MSIDPISANEKIMPLADSVRKLYQSVQEHGIGKAKEKAEEPVSVSLQRSASTMGRLGSVNEESNLVAKGIRETDGALREVSGTMERMKEQLDKVVKNWPPFSPDSAERKELLMSYSSLRKEILKLTFPPPPEAVYEKNTSLWEKLGYTDQKQLVYSIPELPDTATDGQVKSAAANLDDLRSLVSDGIKELVRTVTE
jgi:hypothetical protein